jgi:hypothetical protein
VQFVGNGGDVRLGLAVEVVQGDALECPADVLAAGYSVIQIDNSQNQAASLKAIGIRALPKENEYRLLPGQGIAQAKHILLVGVPTVKNSPSSTVEESPYRQARYLGQQFLEALWLEGIRVRHLATTIHGLRINFNGVVNAKGGYLTYDEILAVIPGLEHNIDLLTIGASAKG